jgi:PhnB protein
MITINPYLNFPGNTEEAFNFYKSIFGGEFVMIQRFGDTPEAERVPAEQKDKIMHIALPVGGSVLMATDALESMGHKITAGTNFHLSVNPDSKEETDKLFAAMSEGGKITVPLAQMFWGDYFGMCTDKFGIQWMFSYNEKNKS